MEDQLVSLTVHDSKYTSPGVSTPIFAESNGYKSMKKMEWSEIYSKRTQIFLKKEMQQTKLEFIIPQDRVYWIENSNFTRTSYKYFKNKQILIRSAKFGMRDIAKKNLGMTRPSIEEMCFLTSVYFSNPKP